MNLTSCSFILLSLNVCVLADLLTYIESFSASVTNHVTNRTKAKDGLMNINRAKPSLIGCVRSRSLIHIHEPAPRHSRIRSARAEAELPGDGKLSTVSLEEN